MHVGLRILILGRIPPGIRLKLEGMEDGSELLEPREPWDIGREVGALTPHLLVLGEGAPALTPGSVLEGRAHQLLPVLSTRGDSEADLRLPEESKLAASVLRSARKLARMRRALLAALEADNPFPRMLDMEFDRAVRYRHPLSLITMSVDDIQGLTTTYGDGAADLYLEELASALRRALRDCDLLFRARENEIAILLPDTPALGACVVAERLRIQTGRLLVKPPLRGDKPALPLKATPSIGVADAPREGLAKSGDLLERARKKMEQARLEGGDRVVLHMTPTP